MVMLGLPPPQDVGEDLLTLARRRRSGLPVACAPLPVQDVSTVLACAAGAIPMRPGLRTTPSAGALHPVEVLVIARAVDGLTPGLYAYDPVGHALHPRGEVDPDDFHTRVGGAAAPVPPSLTLALVVTFASADAGYGSPASRFGLLEAGHIAQAALMVATALGLATLPWGAFADATADHLLGLDGRRRRCVYLLAVSAEVHQPVD